MALLFAFALAFALLLAAGWQSLRQSRAAAAEQAMVEHTLVVLQHGLEFDTDVLQMEADHRAFLIEGDRAFEQSREALHARAGEQIAALQALTRDNPRQQQRVLLARRLLAERHDRMRATSALVARDGLAAARQNFAARGQGSLGPLREVLATLRGEEEQLLAQRSRAASDGAQRLRWALFYGPAAGLLLLLCGLAVLWRQLNATERVSARLAQSSAQLQFAYDVAGIGDWDLDLDTGAARRSPRHDQIFGYDTPLASWSKELFLEHVHPDDRAAVEASFQQAVATGGDWNFECRIHWADSSQHWIWACGRVFDRHGDGAAHMLGTVCDITERKNAESDLQNFFRLSRDLICVSSLDGRLLRLNPAWQNTLGYSLEAMLGRPFLDFVHPDDLDATIRETLALAEGRETILFENRYRTADGRWIWLLWNASASPSDGVIYATARDITERKDVEQRVAALNRDLSSRSEALEAANKELEAFSYSVSHDLRAPLRHIDGYARILIEDAAPVLDVDSRRYLQSISDSSRRMGALIDDLLNLARLGRKPLHQQRIDMRELLDSAMRDIVTGEANVAIADLPMADGDPTLIKQVWINLVSNAVKYSAPRAADARIEIAGERAGERVRYTVSDNGVGFDMRYAEKLFGVFQRLHAQDEFEGTGVGLAIVQRIVNRHGGRVDAQAEPGVGATFSFELPVSEATT